MPVKPILDTIRNAYLVPREQVNYGISQNLEPPYLAVLDYQSENVYDTGSHEDAKATAATMRESKWTVVVIHKTVEDAEALAAQVNALLDVSETVTPECMRCFQESYTVGQMEEKLYQWGVMIGYSMTEDLRRGIIGS